MHGCGGDDNNEDNDDTVYTDSVTLSVKETIQETKDLGTKSSLTQLKNNYSCQNIGNY